jgi:hypothetical protein
MQAQIDNLEDGATVGSDNKVRIPRNLVSAAALKFQSKKFNSVDCVSSGT